MKRFRSESGAVAVEFAIVLVPLLLVLMGILDFGRAYTQQLSLSAAAREGVRVMALQADPALGTSVAKQRIRDASPALAPPLADSQIVITAACVPGKAPVSVTVTLTYPLASITGMFDSLFAGEHLTGKAVMRCGG
jgi:Flp pilus assembly protein TadG